MQYMTGIGYFHGLGNRGWVIIFNESNLIESVNIYFYVYCNIMFHKQNQTIKVICREF